MLLPATLTVGVVCGTAIAQPRPEAPPSEDRLQRLERELEQSRERERGLEQRATELASELVDLQNRAVIAARTAQNTEEELSALEHRLRDLEQREAVLRGELGTREDQMAAVLTGLQRLASRPPEALLVQPAPAHDMVRGAILMRAVVPALDGRAGDLRQELQALAALRTDITGQRARISRTVARLTEEKREMDRLAERKKALRQATERERREAAQRATALAADAQSLRDLLARLEQERERREAEAAARQAAQQAEEARRLAALAAAPRPPSQAQAPARTRSTLAAAPVGRPLDDMRGNLPMPARGTLVVRYGEPDAEGGTSRGIRVATRPGAQVVAPGDGTVAFAGPFRGYGLLLIMEHGGGYHTLLSGLSRIDAAVGQRLLAGEPVGVMGGDGTPTLYVEIRRDGQPVNPLPWLSARKG